MCNAKSKKVISSTAPAGGSVGSSGSGVNSNRDSAKFKCNRQEMTEARSALIASVLVRLQIMHIVINSIPAV